MSPARSRALRAGAVSTLLVDGDLRYLRLGPLELVRRIHVAVRDETWNTIPAEREGESVEIADDGFRVTYRARHRAGELDFSWEAELCGGADGTASFTMDGVANASFPYQRIGICVLLDSTTYAGRPYRGRGPAGEPHGLLPELVGVQKLADGSFPPLFDPVEELAVDLDGATARLSFEGDAFELEDQRNWIDASFKAYSHNPVTRLEPWQMEAGTRLRHRVVVRAEGSAAKPAAPKPAASRVTVGSSTRRLPAIGLGLPENPEPPSPRQLALLAALGLAHVRCDLRPVEAEAGSRLAAAADMARELGCGLELALHVDADAEAEVAALAPALPHPDLVHRVLVFRAGEDSTSAATVAAAASALRAELPGVPVGGGSDIAFAELNRLRGDPAVQRVMSFAASPTVHADDDLSLVETPAALADAVRSAQAFAGDAAVAVTPLTLRPRFNPDADPEQPSAPAGGLPDAVDPRQTGNLAAGWTLACIASLAEAGADSATFFETVGWRGVMESESGPPSPSFPSEPGMVFPVYAVLRAVLEDGGAAVSCGSSQPLDVAALALSQGSRRRLLLANLTGSAQTVVVAGMAATGEETVELAAHALVGLEADDGRVSLTRLDANL